MTVKLLLLKSGEDVIADVSEMAVGEDADKKVLGYFLDKPCIVKILNAEQQEEGDKKAAFNVSMYPLVPPCGRQCYPSSCRLGGNNR